MRSDLSLKIRQYIMSCSIVHKNVMILTDWQHYCTVIGILSPKILYIVPSLILFWCPYMVIVQSNGGLLRDVILFC